jgi:hypothetical protein
MAARKSGGGVAGSQGQDEIDLSVRAVELMGDLPGRHTLVRQLIYLEMARVCRRLTCPWGID